MLCSKFCSKAASLGIHSYLLYPTFTPLGRKGASSHSNVTHASFLGPQAMTHDSFPENFSPWSKWCQRGGEQRIQLRVAGWYPSVLISYPCRLVLAWWCPQLDKGKIVVQVSWLLPDAQAHSWMSGLLGPVFFQLNSFLAFQNLTSFFFSVIQFPIQLLASFLAEVLKSKSLKVWSLKGGIISERATWMKTVLPPWKRHLVHMCPLQSPHFIISLLKSQTDTKGTSD